jgi:hypothetical protein
MFIVFLSWKKSFVEKLRRRKKMKYKTVEVGITFNMGNYESRRLAAVVELEEGEDSSVVISNVHRYLELENKRLGKLGGSGRR